MFTAKTLSSPRTTNSNKENLDVLKDFEIFYFSFLGVLGVFAVKFGSLYAD
jgi:hypothetical protein